MVNRKRLINTIFKLISIKSENPPGNEFHIAKFLNKYLGDLGIKTKIYEFKKGRSNIVAVIKGRNQNHSLLVTPHLDTVPAGKNWRFNPFNADIRGNRLYGLGATDCKGNLASALEAINSMVEDGAVPGCNLIFCATADEESGSGLGLIPLLEEAILKPDAALVLDTDDFKIIITQKGLIHFKVKIQGKRAHGAYPWMGKNAIDISMDIIKEIEALEFHYKKNKYLRPPTVNVGTIKGGDKVNIVADWCEFELDLRFLPGMDSAVLLKKIKSIIKRHTKKFEIEIEGVQEPYYISQSHFLVKHLKESMRKMKIKPVIAGSEGATVITFFQEKNIPAIATGFGSGGCAHAVNEFIEIDNLHKGTLVLEEFLKEYKE